MRTRPHPIVSSAVIASLPCLAVSTANAGTYHDLGPGNTTYGLSADGSVACGYGPSQYFHWTEATGVITVGGTVPGAGVGGAPRMNDAGTRFSGTRFNAVSGFNEMSYFDIGDPGWTSLGGVGGSSGTEISSGWGASGDGQSVVGLGWVSAGTAHAIQWTATGGTIDLGSTVPGRSSRANHVNADGTVVAGWQDSTTGFRQGAVWTNGVQELVWIDAAQTQRNGEAGDLTDDGTWAVGNGVSANGWQAWRWSSATGTESLGPWAANPTWRGAATAVSADGNVIVGFYRPFPAPATFGEGFIWTSTLGLRPLTTYVNAALGIDTGGAVLALPLDISADGTAVAGVARNGASTVGFVVKLTDIVPCPWDLDGDGNVGFTDLNDMLGAWGPCPGCPEDLDGDDNVGFTDLNDLLANWGACP